MEITCQLLDLPDLALYHICSYITCPFDLLHFGNTCSRLRQISSASSLWQTLGFRCFHGLWVQLEEGSVEDSPREWLLDIIRKIICRTPKADTKTECVFPNGEKWIRKESPKFRFLVCLLQMAYYFEKDPHPAVLYEKYIYDVGIYERCNPVMDFSTPELNINAHVAEELSNLSQAAERDLRLRKQPFKDKRYYIEYFGSTNQENLFSLYFCDKNVYLCPLLFPPLTFQSFLNDGAGLIPLFPFLGEILLKHLAKHNKLLNTSMMTIWEAIKLFCSVLLGIVTREVVKLVERGQQCCLQDVLSTIFDENIDNAAQFNNLCTYCNLLIPYKEVIAEFHSHLQDTSKSILRIEAIRENLGKQLVYEVQDILFPDQSSENLVSRVNLTDCDFIGGDNRLQEMSCAALISNHGVLVTWQLIGRGRY